MVVYICKEEIITKRKVGKRYENIRTLKNIKNNGGLTLKNGKEKR